MRPLTRHLSFFVKENGTLVWSSKKAVVFPSHSHAFLLNSVASCTQRAISIESHYLNTLYITMYSAHNVYLTFLSFSASLTLLTTTLFSPKSLPDKSVHKNRINICIGITQRGKVPFKMLFFPWFFFCFCIFYSFSVFLFYSLWEKFTGFDLLLLEKRRKDRGRRRKSKANQMVKLK